MGTSKQGFLGSLFYQLNYGEVAISSGARTHDQKIYEVTLFYATCLGSAFELF
jgi:hypothetical protein